MQNIVDKSDNEVEVLVTLISNTAQHAIVEYQGTKYFVEIGMLDYFSDDQYFIKAALLDTPVQ